MKIILSTIFSICLFVSCDKCKDETKHFNSELYPTVRKTFYDWDKVSQVSGDTIFLGIGTEYFVCDAGGQEELNKEPKEFYTDREIVIGDDTILPMTNLLTENLISSYIDFYKETDAFFNSPQYLVQLDNKSLKLNDYYTFYFKGFTVSGAEINDSTIVYIE